MYGSNSCVLTFLLAKRIFDTKHLSNEARDNRNERLCRFSISRTGRTGVSATVVHPRKVAGVGYTIIWTSRNSADVPNADSVLFFHGGREQRKLIRTLVFRGDLVRQQQYLLLPQ
jgi:hypothetical protein